jgi:hypothetical protein
MRISYRVSTISNLTIKLALSNYKVLDQKDDF